MLLPRDDRRALTAGGNRGATPKALTACDVARDHQQSKNYPGPQALERVLANPAFLAATRTPGACAVVCQCSLRGPRKSA